MAIYATLKPVAKADPVVRFEKGIRSERALKLAIAEMYVQGVSTRKVAKITEELVGTEISSVQVSRAARELDEALQAWRDRPLGTIVYLILDARYEKMRHGGVKYIVSDDHAGLNAARRAVFPSVLWQRCQFRLQQNAQSYVP